MYDPKQPLRRKHDRIRRGVAAALTAGLMIPGAVAIAKPPTDADVRPERNAEAPSWRPDARPAVQVDKFYKGALEGAIGSHVWTGDIFGTGVSTAVSFDITLDEAGVPMVTNVVVDEATLPGGVTYEIRGTSTDTDGGESTTTTTSTTMPVEEPPIVEASATVSETSDTTVAGDETTTTTMAEDDDDPTFASRGGVRFYMGDRKAGLLILANGRLGDEPAIAVRTVLVTTPVAPVIDDGDDEETTTTTTVEEPERDKGDRNENRNKDRDRNRDDDRDRGDRDDRRGERGDDDRGRDDRRDNRGSDRRGDHDKPPTNS